MAVLHAMDGGEDQLAYATFANCPVAMQLLEPSFVDSNDPKRKSHERSTSFRVRLANDAGVALLSGASQAVDENEFYTDEFRCQCRQVLHSGRTATFDMLDARTEVPVWYQVTISEFESRLVAVFVNVTERVDREEGWRHAGFQDALTGVYNRRYFLERSQDLISLSAREGWSVGLLYLDLDNFKRINDSFGHGVGDLVLKIFSERIASLVRVEDIFFRIGGDEFGVFLAKTNVKNANGLVTRIQGAISTPIQLPDGSDYTMGVAVGVSVCEAQVASAARLLEEADRAMYAAKRLVFSNRP